MAKINVIVIVGALSLLFFVLELVRRRKLREEYSWLWLGTAIFYVIVATWPGFAAWVTDLIGAGNPSTVFTFLGLQFLVLILIQFSIQLSRMKIQIKDLAQQIAIIDSDKHSVLLNMEPDDELKKEGIDSIKEKQKETLEETVLRKLDPAKLHAESSSARLDSKGDSS